jgi:hypothetical protein
VELIRLETDFVLIYVLILGYSLTFSCIIVQSVSEFIVFKPKEFFSLFENNSGDGYDLYAYIVKFNARVA